MKGQAGVKRQLHSIPWLKTPKINKPRGEISSKTYHLPGDPLTLLGFVPLSFRQSTLLEAQNTRRIGVQHPAAFVVRPLHLPPIELLFLTDHCPKKARYRHKKKARRKYLACLLHPFVHVTLLLTREKQLPS